jgi:hypothetical protein
MGLKNKLKNNSLNWKSVKLEGVIDGDDLQGFVGLEVLEGYNASLLKGANNKKRSFAVSELDGDILSTNVVKKAKKDDDSDDEKIQRHEKTKKTRNINFPGKYVLLNIHEDYFEDPARAAIRSVRFTLSSQFVF